MYTSRKVSLILILSRTVFVAKEIATNNTVAIKQIPFTNDKEGVGEKKTHRKL